jgi:hypothetical protein
MPFTLPVLNACSSCLVKSLWISSITLRFFAALAGVTSHSGGGVRAGEEVATEITEVDLLWVRLGGFAMPLEFLKALELCVWAEAALDRLDRPTRKVGLRSLEE